MGVPINIAILHRDAKYAQSLLDILGTCEEGHEVRVYHSPRKALAEFRVKAPDVLVMEVGNSTIDGIDMCAILRSEPGLMELPIVLVSGSAQLEDITLYFKGVDIITKPVDGNKLLSKIRLYHSLKQLKTTLHELMRS